jgi:hypothetical protein
VLATLAARFSADGFPDYGFGERASFALGRTRILIRPPMGQPVYEWPGEKDPITQPTSPI